MSGSKKRAPAAEASDVEEMLRAAEDELLMGLHAISSSSSSSLNPDLARRFDALKTPRLPPPPKAIHPIPPPQPPAPQSKALETKDQIRGDAMNDDLMARFAALKGPTSSPQPMVSDPISHREDSTDDEQSEDGEVGDQVSKKEVEKVMLWAMDAARLDPSARNDEVDDFDKESDEEGDDDKALESEVEQKKKKKRAHGKWFSLFR